MRRPSSGPAREPEPARQIRFCAVSAGVRVAYATAGRGPALLVPAAWISHLELLWHDPAIRGFFAPLAACRTVIHIGFGCADRSELEKWQNRLDELGITHGVVAEDAFCFALPFRDPDNIALEFFAPRS